MSPRIYITGFILAVFVGMMIIIAALSQSSGTSGGTAVTHTLVPNCRFLERVEKPLSLRFYVTDGKDQVTVYALSVTACVDPGLGVRADSIDMIFENAKEAVYRSNDKSSFKTALEIKTTASDFAFDHIQTYPEYKGKIAVFVDTVPGSKEINPAQPSE